MKLPAEDGYTWVDGRLSKIRKDTQRPPHIRPDIWTHIGKAERKRYIAEWAKEGPKRDAARTRRGSLDHVPADDGEYLRILSEARAKLGIPKAPAMPFIRRPDGCVANARASSKNV